MSRWYRVGAAACAVLLLLGLSACGKSVSDSTPDAPTSGDGLTAVTDMASLDGMWSINGVTKLYFNSEDGYYVYRAAYGLGGRGEFYAVNGKPMIRFNGFLYDFLLRDDGVLLPNQNGESSDNQSLTIHRNTFRRDDTAEIIEWTPESMDGVWQNAAGETIVLHPASGQYVACSPDEWRSGTVHDNGEGMGTYLYDDGKYAYLCVSADGNSFTVSGDYGRYDDGTFDGVFYRDGDIGAYTDLAQSKFYSGAGSDDWLWYFDGVNTYFLGTDYEIGSDGFAHAVKDGKIYPAGWIPDRPYDPAADWGDDWTENGAQ